MQKASYRKLFHGWQFYEKLSTCGTQRIKSILRKFAGHKNSVRGPHAAHGPVIKPTDKEFYTALKKAVLAIRFFGCNYNVRSTAICYLPRCMVRLGLDLTLTLTLTLDLTL